ncbi:hypothetical protein L6164_035240 [Bauhinia variegata]|uniref:Uncharacterized protein n=1 Tax=Bauhinia variegata TaxID=167791 RepID=A0ACB9KY30_BAUVA|nr:hypothetical protein L6164_035240 [Bauhinia variegata]
MGRNESLRRRRCGSNSSSRNRHYHLVAFIIVLLNETIYSTRFSGWVICNVARLSESFLPFTFLMFHAEYLHLDGN